MLYQRGDIYLKGVPIYKKVKNIYDNGKYHHVVVAKRINVA